MFMGFILPSISVYLYVFLTEGTIKFFKGTPSDTAMFWTRVVGSADALFAYLSLVGLFTNSNKLIKVILKGQFIYG